MTPPRGESPSLCHPTPSDLHEHRVTTRVTATTTVTPDPGAPMSRTTTARLTVADVCVELASVFHRG